jgi:hypothetical protein
MIPATEAIDGLEIKQGRQPPGGGVERQIVVVNFKVAVEDKTKQIKFVKLTPHVVQP